MGDYDVIVLGTGAAGLTAAVTAAELGAKVGLFEKGATLGGTTVYSGGMIWIPLNQHEPPEKGDSREKALEYLRALSNDTISDEMAETYIDVGPEMVRWLDERTPVKFRAVPDFPDYHPEQPGGMPQGGRSLETETFPYGELGEWADRVHISPYYPSYHLTIGETTLGQAVPEELDPRGDAAPGRQRRARDGTRARRPPAEGLPRPRRRAADQPPRRRADHGGRRRRRRRLRDARGAHGGARAQRRDRHRRLRAQRRAQAGVPARAVHAHGGRGDEHGRRAQDGHARRRDAREHARGVVDADDRAAHRHRPDRPAAAHLRADAAGSDHGQQGRASASPTRPPTTTRSAPPSTSRTRPWACTATCRAGSSSTRPGSTSTASPAAWAEPRRPARTGSPPANTPTELAEKLGIPADALEETIERFNANARDLHDPDFNRGWSAQDKWWGDPTLRDGTARASLGPVETAPYYAIQVFSGALGTKGGPATDTHARVLDVDGDVITGLYAAGNAMASPLGMTYGGAGGTLGPAMVFGYLAGRDIAQRAAARDPVRPGLAPEPSKRSTADRNHGSKHDLAGEGRGGHRLPGDAPGLLHDPRPR